MANSLDDPPVRLPADKLLPFYEVKFKRPRSFASTEPATPAINLDNRPREAVGEVTSFGTPTNGSLDQAFSAKWNTDVNVSYTFNRSFTVSAGVDSVFDVYRDANNQGDATTAGE